MLISRDQAYSVRDQVIVAYVTTRIRNIPAEVQLGPEDGLNRRCVVNLDNVHTIRLDYLRERVALLSHQKIEAIDSAIHFALGLRD